jgi:hypothetical protein
MNREFERRPDLGFMVARDRFKYRFKLSALRHNPLPFENYPKISLKKILIGI